MNPISYMNKKQKEKYLNGERYFWFKRIGEHDWELREDDREGQLLAIIYIDKSGHRLDSILLEYNYDEFGDAKYKRFNQWKDAVKFVEDEYGIWTE